MIELGRNWIRPATALVIGVCLCACLAGIVLPSAARAETIRAAVPANFPPHYLIDNRGEPEGFAIDVLEALAKEADIDVAYDVLSSWKEVESVFKAGQADIIPNLGITKARQEWADFTRSLETFPIVVIIRSGSNLAGFEALKGRRVAGVRFNVGARILSGHEDIDTVLFDTSREALLALLTGDVDAWVYPESVAWRLARQAGLQDRIKVAGEPVREILRGIAVQKSRPDLKDRLDKVAARFVLSQEYQDIYAKWHGRPEPFWTPQRVGLAAGGAAVLLLLTGWVFLTVTLRRQVRSRTRELTLLLSTAVEANKAQSVDDLMRRSLKAICREMGYPVGHVYVPDPQSAGTLVSSRTWHLDDSDGFSVFREITEETALSPGEGLPGRVVTSLEPAWIEDVQQDPNFPRAKLARDIGVHGAVAFPVLVSGQVLAVFEFFSREPARPEPQFFQGLSRIGSDLGRVMERIAIQDELNESQERLDLAVRGSGDAMWEFDSRSEVNWFSPRFVEMLGYQPDELPNTLDTWVDHLHPDDTEQAFAAFSDHVANDAPYDIEYRLRMKTGDYRWFRARAKSLRDADGRAYRTSGTVSDITERKNAEERSKASERRLAKAQDIATLGSWDWNIASGKITWSEQIFRIFGLDPEHDQPTYDGFLTAIHPHDREAVVEAVNACLADAAVPYRIEHRIVRPDGSERIVNEIGEVLRDAENNPVHMTGVVQDITERKEAEKELAEAYAQISSSIDYASNIQKGLLPDGDSFRQAMGENFVVWEPRDVVGGDFYWIREWAGGRLLVLGDCTGHGVPGAFMTLIATATLNRSLRETPSGKLDELMSCINGRIKTVLGQGSGGSMSDDGMDAAMVFFPGDSSSIGFCGAGISLFVKKAGEITEPKGTRHGVGFNTISKDQVYEAVEIARSDFDTLYLASDGVFDQTGGERGHGFGKRRFRETISMANGLTLPEQGQHLIDAVRTHQGGHIRRDDITIIGIEGTGLSE